MSENTPHNNPNSAHRTARIIGSALASAALLNGLADQAPTSTVELSPDLSVTTTETGQPDIDITTGARSATKVRPTDTTITPHHSVTVSTPNKPKTTHTTAEHRHTGKATKTPHPIIPPEKPKPNPGPEPERYGAVHPENLKVTPEASQLMKENTLHIPELGCSGYLIRNDQDQPIGYLTAEHCSLRGDGANSTKRFTGADGKTYVVFPDQIPVFTGDSEKTAEQVGTTAEFILPSADDRLLDVALGVFANSNPQEVLDRYNQLSLTAQERNNLNYGDPMYMSGWPVYQPNNNTAGIERQTFPMSIIGSGITETSLGEGLFVTWAAVSSDADGSECSFGASGSEGFTMVNGKPQIVGTLSAFYDLTGKVWGNPGDRKAIVEYFKDAYSIDISDPKIAAICGFSYKAPDLTKGGQIVNVVSAGNQIPGNDEPASQAEIVPFYTKKFEDPSTTKTIVNGRVKIAFAQGKGGGPDTVQTLWVNNPVIYYDSTDAITAVGYEDDSQNSASHLSFYEFAGTVNVELYSDTKDDPVTLQEFTGTVTVNNAADGTTFGSYTTPDGTTFGQVKSDTEADTTRWYLGYDGKAWSVSTDLPPMK